MLLLSRKCWYSFLNLISQSQSLDIHQPHFSLLACFWYSTLPDQSQCSGLFKRFRSHSHGLIWHLPARLCLFWGHQFGWRALFFCTLWFDLSFIFHGKYCATLFLLCRWSGSAYETGCAVVLAPGSRWVRECKWVIIAQWQIHGAF